MRPARRTDGDAPANAMYVAMATIVTTVRRRRPRRPARAADRRCHDGDVPAGDRDDVAHAGRRERCGDITIDAVAEPDEDARGEAGLGLGQDRGQGVGGRATHILQGSHGTRVRSGDDRPVGAERARCTDPLEVVAIATVGARAYAAADLDPIARTDLRIAWEGRREPKDRPVHGLQRPQRRDLIAVAWRPDGLHDHRPRTLPGRRLGGCRRTR